MENATRIRRKPSYLRPKKRGEGLTQEPGSVELERPGLPPLTKDGPVREAVQEILGVDEQQFSQIAMIAQGDFRKLLTASTKDRSAIFRKIFHTDFCVDFQQRLENERKRLERAHQRIATRLAAHADAAEFPDGSPLRETIIAHLEDGTLVGTQLEELLDRQIDADREEHTRLNEELQQVQETYEALSAQQEQARARIKLLERKTGIQAALIREEQELPTAERAFADARSDREEGRAAGRPADACQAAAL
jgi:exonuclease SbcC